MSESYLWSKEFQEGMKKVGPGSKFWYRSRFDPLTQEEYEMNKVELFQVYQYL